MKEICEAMRKYLADLETRYWELVAEKEILEGNIEDIEKCMVGIKKKQDAVYPTYQAIRSTLHRNNL